MVGWSRRREPVFDAPETGKRARDDLRAGPDDRVGGRRKRRAAAREDDDDAPRARAPARRSLLGRLFGRSSAKKARKEPAAGIDRDREPPEKPVKKSERRSRRRRRSVLGMLTYWTLVMGVWGVIGATGLVAYHASKLPPIDQLAIPKRPPNIAILAADGTLLANRGDTGGPAIHLADMPAYLPKAFVAIEDRRFYSHWGVDIVGVGRAIFRNATGSAVMQGGSTLTQQLAKNLFLTQERTFSRKVQEAILAVWLERKYSKDQILELYLNRVYFGAGAYGVEAAAQRYFGKPAKDVTLPEAAILAGLMKAPTRLAPTRNPEAAAARAAQVITAMAQEGHITEQMAKLALARPAYAKKQSGAGSINYVADYVMDVLDDTIGAIDADIVVTTTILPAMQTAAERALALHLEKFGAKYDVENGALVAMDPSGPIRALVGGRDYNESQFNRAVAAHRQPGSAFKPFVYLAALERGLRPDSVRTDGPINVQGWRPENSSRDYFGPVTLTRALALSLNTVAVRLALEVGPKAVVQTAQRLGISSPLTANASIALGTSEVTPLELVGAYATFANGGIRVQPHIIVQVKKTNGRVLYRRKGAGFGRVVEPQYIAMMNAMMQETLLTGTARKADVGPGWQAAGKTGTSQDYRDGWFVGYTSHLVAGVWLGNDDSSATKKVSGGNLPVEVWTAFMRDAHKGVPPQALPSGVWSDPTGAPPRAQEPAPQPVAPAPVAQRPAPTPVAAAAPGAGLTPPAPIGAPMTINPPGRVFEQKQARPPREGDLLPPASIGGPPQRAGAIPQREKNILERMFGG